jgi:hypothetical protein
MSDMRAVIAPAHADNHVGVVVTTALSPAAITEVADRFAIDHPDCGRRSVDRL